MISGIVSASSQYLPHGFCISWNPELLWTIVSANLVIGLSYVVIAGALLRFTRVEKDLKFHSTFLLFATFILSCGVTHFFDVATIWEPVYRLDAVALVITAIASFFTAVSLFFVTPRVSAFLAEKRAAERDLRSLNQRLTKTLRELETRMAADALHLQNEAQFHLLVDSVTDTAIYLVNTDGTISTWNSGAERIKGYTEAEAIGLHISVFYTLEDIAMNRPEAALKSAETYGQYHSKGWHLRKNGSRFLAEITINAIRDNAGILTGFSKVTRDITRLKEAEDAMIESERQRAFAIERQRSAEALRRVNEMLTKILEASPVGIVTLDGNGMIESWNKAAEQIYGYSAAEMVGHRHEDLVRSLDIGLGGVSPDQMVNLASGEDVHRDIQATRRRKDGRVIEVSVSSAPITGDDGQRAGIVFVIEDVTARNAIAEQLRHSQKMEAIGQLTGGIAHDFNNLLSIVISNLELLETYTAKPEEAHLLREAAMEASLRGAELVSQLMAYSRTQRLAPKLLHINTLVQDMAKLLKRTLGEQIEIVLNTSPDINNVMIDPVQFQTALTNLATNARDAMPEGGKLVIQTGNVVLDEYAAEAADIPPGNYVMLAVTDSGIGMTPETAARAFDPFFTTKRVGQGTGLGLSMVFGFVKQSGGHIRIYSELGEGTAVKVYLPSSDAVVTSKAMPEAAVESPGHDGATILVVEDNEALAKSAQALLNAAGFATIAATNGRQALDILRSDVVIDLLFTDIVMPGGMNGIELARQAVIYRPGLKVLFTSGFADAAIATNDSEELRENLISKPYRKAELIQKINKML